jgi:hypothetical protein
VRGRICASIFGSLLLLTTTAGCASKPPQSAVASDTTPDRIALNRFVEYFSVRVERAADEIAQQTRDPTIARNSVYWKMRAIPAAQATLLIADDQAAAIQLWLLSAAQVEIFDVASPSGFGDGQPVAQQAAKEIDERVKRLASTLLTPEQVTQAQKSVQEYVEGHVGRTGLESTPEEARSWSQSLSSILQKPLDVIEAPLSSLNPTSGLSDTALAVQNFTDEFSRARTELGYLPSELRWNTQLLLMEIEQRLNLSGMTAGVAQIGASADSLAQTARTLPESLRTQLNAFAEELSQPQSQVQATLREANTTLETSRKTAQAIEAMGSTLTGTFEGFTKVMATFEPDPSAAPTPPGEQGPPFDINDYGRTAEKVTETAQALSALLTEADALSSRQQPPALLALTEATARSIVDRAALAGGALVLFTALVAFGYRLAVSRLKRA